MPSDHNNPLSWIDAALDDLERRDLRRHQATRTGAQSAHITIDGRDLINFGSNDYLGLASDERLIAAAHAAARARRLGQRREPARQWPQRISRRTRTPPRRIRRH